MSVAPSNLIASSLPSSVVVDPVDLDLVVRSIPRDTLQAGKPFCVAFTLGVTASVREGQQRTLSLAVQHVQPSTARTTPETGSRASTIATSTTGATASRLASAVAMAMASSSPTPRASLSLLDGPLVGSPRATQPAEQDEDDDPASRLRFPPPVPTYGDEARYDKLRGATRFLGASTLLVPPMTLVRTHPESSSAPGSGGGSDNDNGGGTVTEKEVRFWDFELEYTPLKTGFVLVGGLRILLLEDRVHGAEEEEYPQRRSSAPLVLKEWDVIGEIWVKS
jgi:trafficking protein particle complex subunit 13